MANAPIPGFNTFPGFLLSYVGASFRLGIPTLQAFENYIAQGFNIDPARFYSAYQFTVAAHDASGYVNSLEPNFLPDPTQFPEAITKQLRKYSYTVEYQVYSDEDSETDTRYFTVSSNVLFSSNAVLQATNNAVQRNYLSEFDQLISSRIVSVNRAGSAGTIL